MQGAVGITTIVIPGAPRGGKPGIKPGTTNVER
jgi:hypothetical protein